MKKTKSTYETAGVNIDNANSAKLEMAEHLRTKDPRVLNGLGAFASLFEANFPGVKHPVLVLKAEEPGSKQLLAVKYKRAQSIAYDLINHLINDIVVMGATPLAVLDTIICGKLEKEFVVELVKSISQACKEQSCSLVGGETSEQPGVIPDGRFILAASIVGVVDKTKIIDGARITEGDTVIAIASNGLHTNGYSLVRHLIDQQEDLVNHKVGTTTFLDAVMVPHLCYYHGLKGLFDMPQIHGLAHITGGGIGGNLNRILPQGLNANIDLGQLHPQELFRVIQKVGDVPLSTMMRTFNMGVGMAMVAHPSAVGQIKEHLQKNGYGSNIIGEIVQGNQSVEFHGKLDW